MSGHVEELPDDLDLLAGEYVLGVLESAERRDVQRQAGTDRRMERAIVAWERRLAPMAEAAARIPSPAGVWARIEEDVLALRNASAAVRPPAKLSPVPSSMLRPASRLGAPPRRPVGPWKAATFASWAVAAGVAALLLVPSLGLRRPAVPVAMPDSYLLAVLTAAPGRGDAPRGTVPQMASEIGSARLTAPQFDLATESTSRPADAGFLASARPDGTLMLTALAPVRVPNGQTLELWIAAPNAAAPRSLGLLPAAGRQVTLPAVPEAGTTLIVTVEPEGGSTTQAPSGPTLYSGTFQRMRL